MPHRWDARNRKMDQIFFICFVWKKKEKKVIEHVSIPYSWVMQIFYENDNNIFWKCTCEYMVLEGWKLSLAFWEDANQSTGICTLHNLYISMNFKNHAVICESVLYSSTNYYSCIIMPLVWTLIPLDAENAKTQFYTGFKDRCTCKVLRILFLFLSFNELHVFFGLSGCMAFPRRKAGAQIFCRFEWKQSMFFPTRFSPKKCKKTKKKYWCKPASRHGRCTQVLCWHLLNMLRI